MAQQVQFYKRNTTIWVPKPLINFSNASVMLAIVGHTDQVSREEGVPHLVLITPGDRSGVVTFMTPAFLEAHYTPLFGAKYTEEGNAIYHRPDYQSELRYLSP